jgi:hypothetical protein
MQIIMEIIKEPLILINPKNDSELVKRFIPARLS